MYMMYVAPKRITTEEKNLLRRNIPIAVPFRAALLSFIELPLIYAKFGSPKTQKSTAPRGDALLVKQG
jgi:hypothetical protein